MLRIRHKQVVVGRGGGVLSHKSTSISSSSTGKAEVVRQAISLRHTLSLHSILHRLSTAVWSIVLTFLPLKVILSLMEVSWKACDVIYSVEESFWWDQIHATNAGSPPLAPPRRYLLSSSEGEKTQLVTSKVFSTTPSPSSSSSSSSSSVKPSSSSSSLVGSRIRCELCSDNGGISLPLLISAWVRVSDLETANGQMTVITHEHSSSSSISTSSNSSSSSSLPSPSPPSSCSSSCIWRIFLDCRTEAFCLQLGGGGGTSTTSTNATTTTTAATAAVFSSGNVPLFDQKWHFIAVQVHYQQQPTPTAQERLQVTFVLDGVACNSTLITLAGSEKILNTHNTHDSQQQQQQPTAENEIASGDICICGSITVGVGGQRQRQRQGLGLKQGIEPDSFAGNISHLLVWKQFGKPADFHLLYQFLGKSYLQENALGNQKQGLSQEQAHPTKEEVEVESKEEVEIAAIVKEVRLARLKLKPAASAKRPALVVGGGVSSGSSSGSSEERKNKGVGVNYDEFLPKW